MSTVTPPPSPNARPPSRLWRLLSLGWRWVAQESIPQMAAALAYRTIFSLVPLVLLGFLVVRLFHQEKEGGRNTFVEDLLRKVLGLTGLDQIKGGEGEFNLETWLRGLLEQFSGVSLTGVGIVSALMLVYAAFSLLVEVEKSFNNVYGAMTPRSWARRLTQYWLVLTLGPIMLYASFFTAEQFGAFAKGLALQGSSLLGSWLISFAGFLTSALISWGLLLLLYITVPNTRVRARPAMAGAAVAAVCLEIAKYAFRGYLTTAGYKSLYGALAVLPLFLLWLYTTWFIVLAGLRIAFVGQHGSRGLLMSLWRSSGMDRAGLWSSAWLDPAHAATIMAEVACGFRDGKPRKPERIANDLGLDALLVRRVLTRLMERGLVVRISSGRHQEAYSLARPAELIDGASMLEVGYELSSPIGNAPSEAFVRRMRDVQLEAAKGVTLAHLLDKPKDAPAPGADLKLAPESPSPAGPARSNGNPPTAHANGAGATVAAPKGESVHGGGA